MARPIGNFDPRAEAERIAAFINKRPQPWALDRMTLRDIVDQATNGDLLAIRLDILTDMVASRLRRDPSDQTP